MKQFKKKCMTSTLMLLLAKHKHFRLTNSFKPSIESIPFLDKFKVCNKCKRHTPYMRNN